MKYQKHITVLLFVLLSFFSIDSIWGNQPKNNFSDARRTQLKKLQSAYPSHIIKIGENDIQWADGTEMPFDDGTKNKGFEELLNQPDLQDQFNMVYPKGKLETPPVNNEDPGRVRYEPFFCKMYGDSKKAVQKNLVQITWLPKSAPQ